MKLLFYYSQENAQTLCLENLIRSFITDDFIEIYKSLDAVTERVRGPIDNITTAVFVASNLAELKDFYKLRKYFFELRHIIILPEKDEKMIAVAHKLRPRFLSYFENDFNVVSAVLKKMYSDKCITKRKSPKFINQESAGIAISELNVQ